MNTEDLYSILGVNKHCTKEAVKKAYNNKAKKTHPDTVGDKAKGEFNLVNKAYKILIDNDKRKRYDNGENVDNILKPKNNMALSVLAQCLLQAIQQIDVDKNDIIQLVKDKLEENILNLDMKINEQQKLESKFDIFLKNLKYKKKDNIISQVIQANIFNTKSIIKKIEQEKKVYIEAKKIIKDFSYNFEQITPVQFMQFQSTTGI